MSDAQPVSCQATPAEGYQAPLVEDVAGGAQPLAAAAMIQLASTFNR